jgi:hypothetical protein
MPLPSVWIVGNSALTLTKGDGMLVMSEGVPATYGVAMIGESSSSSSSSSSPTNLMTFTWFLIETNDAKRKKKK